MFIFEVRPLRTGVCGRVPYWGQTAKPTNKLANLSKTGVKISL
jgi:hypothetical protein